MDIFAPASAPTLALLGFRVGGLVLVAPMFASRTVPMLVRAGLVVLLTWLLHPVALATLAGRPVLSPATALAETMIGFGIGFGVAIMVGAAEAMGDLLSVQIGLSGAATLDPMTNQSVPVLGQFASLFAVTLLLSLDAHIVMLDSVAGSLNILPVGGLVDMQAGAAAMVSLGSSLFLLGLRFAAPVIAAVLLANVALAILGRAAPQLNILAVAFPVQIGLGLLVMLASIPLVGAFFTGWTGFYEGMLMHVLNALGGGR